MIFTKQRMAAILFTALLMTPMISFAQTSPTFEVATIKRSDPAKRSRGFNLSANRFSIRNQDVQTLLSVAYSIHPKQIVNAPDWFSTERFDINGVADTDKNLTVTDAQGMIRAMLTERFGITLKHEKRELPVYALTVGKDGPKLAVSKSDPNSLPNQNMNGKGSLVCTNTSMTMFLLGMQSEMDRPLLDQTALTGKYDFTLRWTPDTTAATGDADAPPGIFTAIQEQLGLKLLPVKAAVDAIVIEASTRPTEN